MKKLLTIIASLLVCIVSYGQSTSGWQTVVTDSSGLYTNGTLLAGDTGIYKPAYACFTIATDPLHLAESVVVTAGTSEQNR